MPWQPLPVEDLRPVKTRRLALPTRTVLVAVVAAFSGFGFGAAAVAVAHAFGVA
jgi:hypothetical protein